MSRVIPYFMLLPAAYFFILPETKAQSLYEINILQRIEINFTQSNWDYQMDTAKTDGVDGYLMAEWVVINGEFFDSVGVKYKGNSSYDSTYLKNPMHISMDEFREQSFHGYTDIKLGNGYSDPSMIREGMAYNILSNYMDCPQANFAQLYINGNYIGLFSNVESINSRFCSDHFYSSGNTFIKGNPDIPTPFKKSNLKYINADSSSYFDRYEIKSDQGWNDLVALCDSVTNNSSAMAAVVDLDKVLWMIAFNNVLVNLDSYSGAFAQNHYLYLGNTGHYNPVVWDLNMAFGGFPFSGTPGNGMGALDIAGMQQMSPMLHETHADWPLISGSLINPTYKRMYVAHLRTILNDHFTSGSYLSLADQLQNVIDTAMQSDQNSFFTYTDFQNGLTADVTVGSYDVPGISNLMGARLAYLQAAPELLGVPPIISNVNASDTAPAYLDDIFITAEVTNVAAGSVWLGYRPDVTEKFLRIPMYDDGNHNDGAAGDNVYGNSLTVSSAYVQYYIYSENNDAGIFSPERAEHEYYSVNADIQSATPGQVVINEFLAVNQSDTTDENGAHEDWIEFYNTTSSPLSMFGLYLTDNYTNPTKFSFPENTIIQPNGYLIVWADEDNSASSVHCNFKLSGSGESLMLSNSTGTVLDSISFGGQAADISMGRCPNATGPFLELITPSFNEANRCNDGVEELHPGALLIYPTPADHYMIINSPDHKKMEFEIRDLLGGVITIGEISNSLQLDVSGWTQGLYLFRSGYITERFLILHR